MVSDELSLNFSGCKSTAQQLDEQMISGYMTACQKNRKRYGPIRLTESR
jgi:hypothetical protein